MADPHVRVTGVKRVKDELRRARAEIQKARIRGVRKAALLIEREGRIKITEKHRQGSGALRASWRSQVTVQGGEAFAAIGSELVYANIQNEGDDIYPKTAGALTIPLDGTPQGARAADYPEAFILRLPGHELPFLAQQSADGGLDFLFVLAGRVTIPGTHYVDETFDENVEKVVEMVGSEIHVGIRRGI